MRNVTLAAVQGSDIPFDRRFDCLSDGFVDEPAVIMKEHVMPRLNKQLDLLEQCAGEGIVLALTNEDICNLGWFLTADEGLFSQLVLLSAQAAEERLSALALKSGMYIAACYIKRISDKNYNIVSIFGPCGKILGEYRKTHVPPNEMWQYADGDELNTIELDFGKIGVLICYDMMFPEAASSLAASGVEVILHPTAGYGWYDSIGEATLRTRANDNSCYILTAKNYVYNAAGKSSIIDPWGQVLAEAGFYKDVIVSKTVDLDIEKTQPEWFYQSQMSGIANIGKRYRQERRPELYSQLTEKAKRLRVPDQQERAKLREKIRNGECHW